MKFWQVSIRVWDKRFLLIMVTFFLVEVLRVYFVFSLNLWISKIIWRHWMQMFRGLQLVWLKLKSLFYSPKSRLAFNWYWKSINILIYKLYKGICISLFIKHVFVAFYACYSFFIFVFSFKLLLYIKKYNCVYEVSFVCWLHFFLWIFRK